MAQIVLTIPDEHIPKILEAFEATYPDRPQSISKADWAKLQVAGFIKKTTVQYLRSVEEAKIVLEGVTIS